MSITIMNEQFPDNMGARLLNTVHQHGLYGIQTTPTPSKNTLIDDYYITAIQWVENKVGYPLPLNDKRVFARMCVNDYKSKTFRQPVKSTVCNCAGDRNKRFVFSAKWANEYFPNIYTKWLVLGYGTRPSNSASTHMNEW